MARSPPAVREGGGNITFLPGEKRPESLLWDYLAKRPADGSPLWEDLGAVGVFWENLVESAPEDMYPGETERNMYKRWFRCYERTFERARVVEHWVDDNRQEAEAFINNFLARQPVT